MITAEIKIHEEPEPYTYTTYTNYTSYSLMIGNEKLQYEERYNKTVTDAKAKLKVGDKVKLSSTGAVVHILGFVEQPKDVILYCGEMCTIYASHDKSNTAMGMRYSLQELNMETLNKTDQPLLLPGANDGLPC